MADLPPDIARELGAALRGLEERGYRKVEECSGLRAGARVYHRGQQWPGASRGTGEVLAVLDRPSFNLRQDVEIVVLFDKPWPFRDSRRLWVLADYNVCAAVPREGGERRG